MFLFCNTRSTDAKIYLNEYFSNSYQALSADFDLHLFLMSLQCFEVSYWISVGFFSFLL